MKINSSLGLLACGVALATSTSWAQTTPTGTVNSTTYPQGAIAPDSTSSKASSRSQKRAMRQNSRTTNQNGQTNGTSSPSTQNARFQQSSASDGTATNNSNTTNYNSNNATNPATGVGSNPNSTNVSTQSNQTGGQSSNGTMSSGSRTQTTSETNSDAGAVEAIKGAKTTETPAVKAGSTVRNTSIGDFVSSSPNFTTLQNALQSSDLFETLKGGGPYTIFAPTNDAFKKLPTSVQSGLLDGSNKDALKQLLSYHVVNGTLSSEELSRQIKANNGKAQLKTLSGSTLTAKLDANGRMSITDEQGKTVQVEGTGNGQSNGMVYKIDGILMPKSGATFR